jgi:hypothetical protein
MSLDDFKDFVDSSIEKEEAYSNFPADSDIFDWCNMTYKQLQRYTGSIAWEQSFFEYY